MPSYTWDIIIEDGTTEDDPKTKTLKLHIGVITKVDIKFPPGCHGMVKVHLLRFGFQLFPLSRSEWITGDDETVSFPEYYELITTPAELKFVGVSPGTGYDHTITVRVTVLPKAVATFMPLINIFTKFLKRIGVTG